MKTFALGASLFLTFFSFSFADKESAPYPKVTASSSGNILFQMVPGDAGGKGIAYRMDDKGGFVELWRTSGWWSQTVFVADDGRHLVRLGNWSQGSEVDGADLAVAFYENGNLLKEYSTADLVKDPSKIQVSKSHYVWQDDAVPMRLDQNKRFHLKTVDGVAYVFDATNGEVVSETRVTP